jgi:two-component system cell cycle response regulator
VTARILVVDDIAANLRLLEAKLLADYYEVIPASSGPEAIEAAFTQSPDIVLLDVMMPGTDGYEVCRRLKASPATRYIPVVMVTALTDPTERVRGLEAGADDFLSKPVDDATLSARVRALLRMKQMQDAWRLRAETARDLGLPPPPDPPAEVAGARACVVSASAAEGMAICQILERDGVLTERAETAEGAWRCLAEHSADLAVLALPRDGAESLRLASRLRANAATRDLPLLLVADPEQKGLLLRGFDIGANDHTLRPIDPQELRARARNQIRRKRMQELLRAQLDRSLEMAVTDPLTGLRNRRYLRRHLESQLQREPGAAVLLIDLDRFKMINDAHGHEAGDAVLKEVARRLEAELRAADVVARWGGEEFVAVLAGAPAENLMQVAERLRVALEREPVRLPSGVELAVTLCVGVAAAPRGGDPDALLRAADAALYSAKASGRNRSVMAESLPE